MPRPTGHGHYFEFDLCCAYCNVNYYSDKRIDPCPIGQKKHEKIMKTSRGIRFPVENRLYSGQGMSAYTRSWEADKWIGGRKSERCVGACRHEGVRGHCPNGWPTRSDAFMDYYKKNKKKVNEMIYGDNKWIRK